MFFPIRTDVPLRSTPWMNWLLIVLNGIVFLFQSRYPQIGSRFDLNPHDPHLLNYLTYAFLHANVGHILSNMLFLYIFGNNVNDRLGHAGYAAFYLAGGVIAGVTHVLGETSPVLGASGAVFAVTGAFLILFPRAHITVLYFFGLIGLLEIPSLWFILAYLLINVLSQFTALLGPPGQVAHLAHLGGAFFGIVVCTALLAAGLLPRDPFDIIAMIDRWNRRRQFRDMVASGYNPFDYAPSAKRGPADPKLEKIQDVRATIAEAIAHGNLPEATKYFMELRAIDPAQVLSRQNQLDIGNYLFEHEHHAAAADAYEGFVRVYPKADQVGHVQLMLGIVLARYLNRPDRAAEHLHRAIDKLRNTKEIEMARAELSHLTAEKNTN